MSEKIYCGNAKEITTKYGTMISVMLDLDDLEKHVEEYSFKTQGGKRKIRLNISRRKEPDQYSNTHSITIDTWKPESKGFEDDPIPF